MNHSCQEVRIPLHWGSLAGKLWVPLSPSPPNKSGVLAIHGILDNACSFDLLVPFLPPDAPVLAIDLPGHGLSDHYHANARCYYFIELISDMIEVLKYMSWDRPVLIGHSFGCLLALAIGAILQKKIGKIVMIEYSHVLFALNETFFEFLKSREDSDYTTSQRDKIYPSRAAIVDRLLAVNSGLDRSSAELLSMRGCREEEGGFVVSRDLRIMNNGSVYDRFVFFKVKNREFFKQLMMPTLILSALDTEMKFEDWMKMDNLELTPTTEVKYVKGNHHVHMNDPSKVGGIIREFISQKVASKL